MAISWLSKPQLNVCGVLEEISLDDARFVFFLEGADVSCLRDWITTSDK